ncbi:MAG: hypothetical protein D3M94_07530 [Rhodocyclales bacterium GT-UBC]|nr:MAG: hypothetical protein D3M94_07530 [Rhodocyclales bacterium GT-UBC]
MNRWLSADHINRLAADPVRCTRSELAVKVDSRHPFVPEDYTQLYFTPVYATLGFEHRLRYNQLFGLRINEYIMMLEADLVERLLTPLLRQPRIIADAALGQAMLTMIEEEKRHCANFAALNRACRPDLYPPGEDRFFSRLPIWTKAMFWSVGALAGRLPFALWFLMAMEESSMALARDMNRRPETETLGRLDPGFVAVHREHMKDESRHLHIDAHMIAACIGTGGQTRRALNARLFQFMLGGVTHLTRSGSGAMVVRQLVREMPELAPREEEMIQALLALKHSKPFQESLFNRRIMPKAFSVFDGTPELGRLGEKMVGYDRR